LETLTPLSVFVTRTEGRYAKDPDGLEFEIFSTVPGGTSIGTKELDLEGELARRGVTT